MIRNIPTLFMLILFYVYLEQSSNLYVCTTNDKLGELITAVTNWNWHKISSHRYNQNNLGICQIAGWYTVAALMNTDHISSSRQTHTRTHTLSRYSHSGEVKFLCLSAGTRVTSSPWDCLPRCSFLNEWWWPRTEPIICSDTQRDKSHPHSYSASNFIFPSKTLSNPHSTEQWRLTQPAGAILLHTSRTNRFRRLPVIQINALDGGRHLN